MQTRSRMGSCLVGLVILACGVDDPGPAAGAEAGGAVTSSGGAVTSSGGAAPNSGGAPPDVTPGTAGSAAAAGIGGSGPVMGPGGAAATGGGNTGGGGTGGSDGSPTGGTVAVWSHANLDLHPDRIGFYMVPDLASEYRAGGSPPAGAQGEGCPWTTTQASLHRLRELFPDVWIRWDNETGHNTSTPENVEAFVRCAENAGIELIIAASAVDGYDNYWANQYVTGTAAPNRTLVDIANGPYLTFAHDLLVRHANVRLVETMNESDGPWFVLDADDNASFDYYMQKLIAAMGPDAGRIVGPSAAFKRSNHWNNFLARTEFPYFSYHTYCGWQALEEVPGRRVHITEYGGGECGSRDLHSPGAILADLYQLEVSGKLSGTIERVYYNQITTDGSNRGGFNHSAREGAHFALRDWLRALSLHQALAAVSRRAYHDPGASDFLGAADGQGAVAVLLWNDSGAPKHARRRVPGAAPAPGAPLHVTRVHTGDRDTSECRLLEEQSWVSVELTGSGLDVAVAGLEPESALLVSTRPCAPLVE